MEQLQLPAALMGDLAPSRLEARAEIGRMRSRGYGHTAIARSLNARKIPTPSGRGTWHPGTVRRFADPVAREAWRAYIATYRARRR